MNHELEADQRPILPLGFKSIWRNTYSCCIIPIVYRRLQRISNILLMKVNMMDYYLHRKIQGVGKQFSRRQIRLLTRLGIIVPSILCVFTLFVVLHYTTYTVGTNTDVNNDLEYMQKWKGARKLKLGFDKGEETLLTLFTTFSDREETRYAIQNYTMQNWMYQFGQTGVVPVVYLSSDIQIEQCQAKGMKTVKLTDKLTEEGRPILKELFLDAFTRYNSKYYGFMNGDILYHGKDIISSLNTITKFVESERISKFLILGMRVNVDFYNNGTIRNLTEFNDNAMEQLEAIGKRHPDVGSYDIFISTKDSFPWSTIPDYVISLPGFDSWLMIFGQKADIPIIDVTESLLIVHQDGVPKKRDKNYKIMNDRNKRLYSESVKEKQVGWMRKCAHFKTVWKHSEVKLVKSKRDEAMKKKCVPTKPLYIPIL
ncbi:unnamed protein product [Owenia fusiformis]|uniref:Uncharacterized protein n=1 Tax=Owenia fusiformis TaxID=6347 RepID=A0A8J1XJS0_OWEFU|nr:unnamed protein product [Owenia fusiformis]